VKVLAIFNRQGVVHNWLNSNCPAVKRVHDVEFRGGKEVHKVVSSIQCRVYRLPCCNNCWGDPRQFKTMLEAQK
jgi:hypothetical protein